MACHSPCQPGDSRADEQTVGEDIKINEDLKAYLSRPSGQPRGAIILMNDVFGYAFPANRVVADGLAANGYVCLIPDLFRSDPWIPDIRGDPKDPTSGFPEWLGSHSQDRIDGDMDASLEYLRERLHISSVGVIGFCWGGYQLMLASRKSADRFKAAVGFYAVKNAPNMAEIALAMKAPTLLLFCEFDKWMSLDTIAEMENALKQANRLVSSVKDDPSKLGGAPVRIKVFGGMEHAFAHRGDRSNPAIMAAAKEAFDDMYEWLKKYM